MRRRSNIEKIGLTFYIVFYVFVACLKNVVLSYGIWDEGAIILSKRLENFKLYVTFYVDFDVLNEN